MNFSSNVKYFKAPVFIIEAAYDEYSLSHIVNEKCLSSGPHGAYSLDKCNSTQISQIAEFRNTAINAINNFTSLESFGAWVPACVQHGFSHVSAAWNSVSYKVPCS